MSGHEWPGWSDHDPADGAHHGEPPDPGTDPASPHWADPAFSTPDHGATEHGWGDHVEPHHGPAYADPAYHDDGQDGIAVPAPLSDVHDLPHSDPGHSDVGHTDAGHADPADHLVDHVTAHHDDHPVPLPESAGYGMGHVGADPDAVPDLAGFAAFPPPVDVGPLPTPVDGFPWSDASTLGGAHGPEGAGLPHEAAPDSTELAAYAGADPEPGSDAWSQLVASDDPATSALARFWRPEP